MTKDEFARAYMEELLFLLRKIDVFQRGADQDIGRVRNEIFESVERCKKLLTSDAAQQYLDPTLTNVNFDQIQKMEDLSNQEIEDLISHEFRTCARFHLDRIVTRQQLRNVVDDLPAKKPFMNPSSANEIAQRVEHAVQIFDGRILQKRSTIGRKQKKATATIALKSVYRVIVGSAFLVCNTITVSIGKSATVADSYFRRAEDG